jgi:hypothetical protein
MDDVWYFGALLTDGTIIGFETLVRVEPDYFILQMLTLDKYSEPLKAFGRQVVYSPTSRTEIRVYKKHLIALFEIADT